LKTLVTGAAGFFGAHLCRRLASDGHEVVALDVRDSPPQLDVAGIRYLQADLRSLDEWRDNLRNVGIVFHLASVHLQVTAAEEEYRAVNVHAAVALAGACQSYGVARLIHASTVGCRPFSTPGSPS
jgi:nucleoside-diphosphate-sugar epimerase